MNHGWVVSEVLIFKLRKYRKGITIKIVIHSLRYGISDTKKGGGGKLPLDGKVSINNTNISLLSVVSSFSSSYLAAQSVH